MADHGNTMDRVRGRRRWVEFGLRLLACWGVKVWVVGGSVRLTRKMDFELACGRLLSRCRQL